VVSGDIQLVGADLAEEFSSVGGGAADPGSVMVLVGDDQIQACDQAYDRRVAGVVSGAGGYRPGLILDRRENGQRRHALALTGKVWCKVDADHAAIEVGDQLTTSSTPGHAMRRRPRRFLRGGARQSHAGHAVRSWADPDPRGPAVKTPPS